MYSYCEYRYKSIYMNLPSLFSIKPRISFKVLPYLSVTEGKKGILGRKEYSSLVRRGVMRVIEYDADEYLLIYGVLMFRLFSWF